MREQTAPFPDLALAAVGERLTARWEQRLPGLLRRLGLPLDGVVQVGAHTGQEVAALTGCGFRRLVMVEPNIDHVPELRRQLDEHHLPAGLPEPADGLPAREVVVAAAGRSRGEATLHVTRWDQQASTLQPLLPLSARNSVVRQDTVPVLPVRDIQRGCNVLVVDAQGSELDVLAGTDLEAMDLAVIEGSTSARYQDGSTLDEIATHMRGNGWRHVAVWDHVRPNVADVAWLAPGRESPPAT